MKLSNSTLPHRPRHIAVWLFCLCGFIGLVVLVGGMTRLTDSGLSITEWKPATGIIPPLSQLDWDDAFAKYQTIPEYRLINQGMTLAQFKTIYWWEWAHRLLARLAGLVFLLPFIYFWATNRLNRRDLPKFVLLFVLGGAQGLLGWYMVKSGLSVRVDVSQYRLAAHLGLAFVVYGYAFWLGLRYLPTPAMDRPYPKALSVLSIALFAAIFVQVLLGALMAGLDAGLTYNEWPLMDGYFAPPGMARLTPLYLNVFENITLVQFNHRWGAVIILCLSTLLWWRCREIAALAASVGLMLAIILTQFALGVWTLLAVTPIFLAAAHQMTGLLSFTAALWLCHKITRKQESNPERNY